MPKKNTLSPVSQELYSFLIKYYSFNAPLLLAFSKGIDSLSLLLALKEIQIKVRSDLDFHVAHVNHNWRESSKKEAKEIGDYVEKQGLTFHCYHIENELPKGNQENESRIIRQQFFNELKKDHAFEAVLLGHQKEDQVETILKRIFEGSIDSIKGIQEEKCLNNLLYWRPFLKISKKVLEKYCLEQKEEALLDPSNEDLQYLRVRFRKKMLPFLEESFGKGIQNNILALTEEVIELQNFVSLSAESYRKNIKFFPTGRIIQFPLETPVPVLKLLIKELWKEKEQILNRSQVKELIGYLLEKKTHKTFSWGEGMAYFDRACLFLPSICFKDFSVFDYEIGFQGERGRWKMLKEQNQQSSLGWEDLLKGFISLPFESDKKGRICSLRNLEIDVEKKKIKEKLSKMKCPQWLWEFVPVFYESSKKAELLLNARAECFSKWRLFSLSLGKG
ncbi:hypothetical protein AB751O23_AZ_00060 [Chlamydiales bacterium SCGC AB-751-O23]|jgi:tRNA(Ile)-lysidine synthase|nr:hypothetical protein AB751O23_AZ_00060 [Chlamydiales bacterium SCGC AB-751-O23]